MSFDAHGRGSILGPTSAHRPSGEKKSVNAWLIAVGIIPTFMIGLGLTLIAMGPSFFILGALVAYLGCAWLLVHCYFFLRAQPIAARVVGAIVAVICGMTVSLVVFRPAPLTISSIGMPEKYADGTDVGEIKWSSKYSGFRTVLRNDSDFQYTNIEFLIRTDVMIAAVGGNAKFSQCSAKPTLGSAVEISGGSIGTKDGNAIPLGFPIATIYKVFCDKLLPHDPVEIVVATRRDIVNGGFDAASAMTMRGTYEAFFRSREFSKGECLIRGCTPVILP